MTFWRQIIGVIEEAREHICGIRRARYPDVTRGSTLGTKIPLHVVTANRLRVVELLKLTLDLKR